MKLQVKPLAMAVIVMAAITGTGMPQAVAADDALIAKGKNVSFDRKKGNCLTCHHIAGGTLMGNIGPPLIAMKARFPDKAALRQLIWDMAARTPETMMPRFGKYKVLSENEIDAVVEFVHTL